MKRAPLVLLPLVALLGAVPVSAQYNWNAFLDACDPPTCATIHAEARKDRLMLKMDVHGDPIGFFTLFLEGGEFGPLVSSNAEATSALGNNIGAGATPGTDYFEVVSHDFFYQFGLGGTIQDLALFRFMLESPIPYDEAGLRLAAIGSLEVQDYTSDPACGPGGSMEGDLDTCPPVRAHQLFNVGNARITRVVPEPATLTLLASGLFLVAWIHRRRSRSSAA